MPDQTINQTGLTTMKEQAPGTKVPKKLLIAMIIGLATALGGAFIIMFYLGAYKDPEVVRAVPPSYRIAYLPHKGPYDKIEPIIDRVAEYLRKAHIEPGTPCALLLDTSKVPDAEKRSKIGYLVRRSDYIPAPLEVEDIPSREVVIASFKGGTLLGSYKAYAAMRKWARAHGYILMLPALEIYHPNGVVEYQLPIRKPAG